MKAVTVQPGITDSVLYEDVPEPDENTGSILVEGVAVGVCGTDIEFASGTYGWAPPGRERLILGHESLGPVLDPRTDRSVKAGDLWVDPRCRTARNRPGGWPRRDCPRSWAVLPASRPARRMCRHNDRC